MFAKYFKSDNPAHIDRGCCTNCGTCEPTCPVKAIEFDPQIGCYLVIYTKCDGGSICNYVCFDNCPVGAICKRSDFNNGGCCK